MKKNYKEYIKQQF